MKRLTFGIALAVAGLCFAPCAAFAQTFANGNNLLPEAFNSGGCVGFADLDGDGYDDLVILDQSRDLHTLYQAPDGSFTDYPLGNVSGSSQWGMCVGDFSDSTTSLRQSIKLVL